MLRALARVNLAAIERNCRRLLHAAGGAELCAVVKADGYGHGAVPAARAAIAGGATWLAVASAGEAADLRAAGLDGRLLVVGALSPAELKVAVAARADVVAWREGFVGALAAIPGAAGIGVHVKLDSGMGRLGTRDAAEADRVAAAVADDARLRLVGAMTHFATADDDRAFLEEQLGVFTPWAERLRARNPELIVHAANSAATLEAPGARFDMVRCGIGVYGLDPFHQDPYAHGLEPALSLESYVAEVKLCAPGQSAGYGRRFTAIEPVWLGTVPIGYGDGVRRGLSNNGELLVSGARRPVVGTISMDNLMVMLGSDGPAAREMRGATAVVIGSQGSERILTEDVATRLQTINYEVACGISARVPRAYHRDGEPVTP